MGASVSKREFALTVGRRDLLFALKTVTRALKYGATDARITFENGRLTVEAGDTAAETPAEGNWPPEVFVDSGWVRRMAKRLPEGGPVTLAVDEERLRIRRYSERCWFKARPNAEQPSTGKPEGCPATAAEAAKILRPLKLSERHIRELMTQAAQREAHPWDTDHPRMISLIAKAWVLLAPFGVEPRDIRRMVDRAIRNAWK